MAMNNNESYTQGIDLELTGKMKKKDNIALKIVIYVVCIFLTALSIIPFWVMICNSTRNNAQFSESSVAFIPSIHLKENFQTLQEKQSFKPLVGFANSFIIAAGSTVLAIYFSSLTAYAQVVYEWKLRNAFFSFIMAVMMLPAQVTMIGFVQFCYQLKMSNNLLMLILPSIAAPSMVFFMRQYLQPALPIEIVHSARIDGAKEFFIFNRIVIPIMKPAMATQAIFSFVSSWNNLFTPSVLLTTKERYTMPIMVSQLRGNIYQTKYGAIYMGLTLTVLPLIIVYLVLSKYIVAGVAVGSVKG